MSVSFACFLCPFFFPLHCLCRQRCPEQISWWPSAPGGCQGQYVPLINSTVIGVVQVGNLKYSLSNLEGMPSAVHTLLQHRIERPDLWNLWRCIDIYRYALNIRQLGSHYIILEVFKPSVTPPAFGRSNLKLLDSRGSSSVHSCVHTSWHILREENGSACCGLSTVPHVSTVPLHSELQVICMVCFRAETCVDSETKKR